MKVCILKTDLSPSMEEADCQGGHPSFFIAITRIPHTDIQKHISKDTHTHTHTHIHTHIQQERVECVGGVWTAPISSYNTFLRLGPYHTCKKSWVEAPIEIARSWSKSMRASLLYADKRVSSVSRDFFSKKFVVIKSNISRKSGPAWYSFEKWIDFGKVIVLAQNWQFFGLSRCFE